MVQQILKTLTGNRVRIYLGDTQIGLIQDLRVSDNYGLEDASGIGDIHVIEHVPTKAVHTLSFSNMVMFTYKLRTAGIAPVNGDQVLAGLVFDVAIYGSDTGAELRRYLNCSYDSGDVTIGAHRIVTNNGQLKALDVRGTGL